MKNIAAFIIAFACAGSINAQMLSKTIDKTTIGPLDCKYSITTEQDKDTIYMVSCFFQNLRYSTIIDLGGIFISSKEEMQKLIADLEKCLPLLEEKGQTVSFEEKGYWLRINDFSSRLYIEQEGKYTTIGKAKIVKFIAWLKTINIPK